MENVFERTRDMFQRTWEPWRDLATNMSWGKDTSMGLENLKPVLETARADYEIGMSAWNSMMDKNEELFFTLFRQVPMYSEAMEERLRGVCDGVRSLRKTQQNIFLDNLKQAENFLKDQAASAEKAAQE